MNVLIVDDENIMRMGLKKTLQNSQKFRVIGEATNGKQALEVVKKTPEIDVILLDINMPIMDGLTFLDEISGLFFGHVIVLSSYDDVDNVKLAIKKGATDYFHKPTMSPKKIITMLENLSSNPPVKIDQVEKERWLREVIYNPTPELLNITYDLNSNQLSKVAVLLSINDLTTIPFTIYDLENIIVSWKNNTAFAAEFINLNQGKILLILSLKTNSTLYYYQENKAFINSIQNYLKKHRIIASFGIGRGKHNILDLHESVEEAQLALEREYFAGRNSVNFYEDKKKNVTNSVSLPSNEVILEGFFDSNLKELLKSLDGYFYKLSELSERDSIIDHVVDLLTQLKASLKKYGEFNPGLSIHPHQFVQTHYFSDLQEKMIEYFQEWKSWINEYDLNNYSPMVRYVMNYIQNRYKEEMKLDDLANVVRTNPSYLSRVFKEQTGETISHYVTTFRIEKAKELLQHTNLKMRDISITVGYANERYFSQVFKQYTGKTPKSFRK